MSINSERVAAGFPELPQDEWAVNLNVRDKSIKKADKVYWAFCELSRELRSKDLDYISVSCYRTSDEDELPDVEEGPEMGLYHDEKTMDKVRTAISSALEAGSSSTYQDTLDIIASLQNAGILFRERR